MKKVKKENIIVCDRCGHELQGSADNISIGKISLFHDSVVGDIFSEGAGKTELGEKRDYFEKHTAVSFGKNPHQSLILKYGGDADYHLCWRCNRDFVVLLGKFFSLNENGV